MSIVDGKVVKDNGDIQHYLNGKLHREDGPALETASGDKSWWQRGQPHRKDGPAVESAGDKEWYLNGLRHRIGGPAIEKLNGDTHYYVDGDLHREDGPAVSFKSALNQPPWFGYYLHGEFYKTKELWEAARAAEKNAPKLQCDQCHLVVGEDASLKWMNTLTDGHVCGNSRSHGPACYGVLRPINAAEDQVAKKTSPEESKYPEHKLSNLAMGSQVCLHSEEHPNIKVNLKLRTPVAIHDYGAVRKLLQMGSGQLCLFCDSRFVYGLGTVVDYDPASEDLFVIKFIKRFT